MSTTFNWQPDHRGQKTNNSGHEKDGGEGERPARNRLPIYSRIYSRSSQHYAALRRRTRRFFF